MNRMVLSIVLLLGFAPATAQEQPYAGYEQRPIKALSREQIADLKAGRGMGLALAAELNGFPGPIHVLELAERLQLTVEQRSAVERSEEHTSELQSLRHLVCRLLLEKKKTE